MIYEHRCEVTIYAFSRHCKRKRNRLALIYRSNYNDHSQTMDKKLAQLSVLNQKDKGATYLSLLSSIFSSQGNPNIANDVHALVDHLINQDAGIIASRQVLSELIKGLTSTNIPDKGQRKAVVEDVLSVVQLRATSYEEQVRPIWPQNGYRY